uniref:Phospholipid-transporting ATPase n=1 Tax=Panagrellus redivivus TaxID=6233 RepID=A0A7E4ZYG2_PANRE
MDHNEDERENAAASSLPSTSSTFPATSANRNNRPEQATVFPASSGHHRSASSDSTNQRRVSFSPTVRQNIYSPPPDLCSPPSGVQRRKSLSYGGHSSSASSNSSSSFGTQPLQSSSHFAAEAAFRQHGEASRTVEASPPYRQTPPAAEPPNKGPQRSSSKGHRLPRKTQTGFARWPQKMGEIFSKCFGKIKGEKVSSASAELGEYERVLRANDRTFNSQFKYADNFIKTSKYNLITFIPKNLFEQFQRLANFYFLVLMILQFIPWISSIVWYSTAIPLGIVLAFSAVKDAYDDVQRHRSDSQVNNRISYIVRNGRLEEEKWMNVKVGDVIRMENEHFIAADLLVLSSSEPHGLCYIETAELDGETNLKTRSALPETSVLDDIVRNISDFDGQISCEAPNNRLDRFEGKLSWKGVQYPLSNENMLLRGCRLRNTRWCYGVVVFAGKDTKLMMNSGQTKFKRTSLDRFLNILIMGIVLFLIAMCLICTILCGVWEWTTGRYFTSYLEWDRSIVPNTEEKGSRQIAIISFLMFFSYIILLNTVVPISLYVSVEILRFVHSMWINFDREMYDAKNDVSARARTTTLNEELGQVQYIFSDKTGTLTQNIMTFNKCSINGRSYGDVYTPRGETVEINENTPSIDLSFNKWSEPTFKFYDKTLLDDTGNVPEVQEFWRLLALCHTVMPESKSANQLEYQAQSPDEAALTSAARNFGYVFKSRTPQSITIEINGKVDTYEVLHLLDFNNVRKRMSIIVKDRNGKIRLYCKGADTIVLERIRGDTSALLRSATTQHLDKFASDGLRTLCVAYKDVEEEYCKQWMAKLKEASLDRYNKEERVDEVYEEIEKDLILLGATAIEDKLQDGVPATIAKLTEANIKIWVLTGDKTETAINIGYSCRLLTEDMKEIFVIEGKTEDEVEVELKDIRRVIEKATNQTNPGNSAFYDGPRENYGYNIAQFHNEPTLTMNEGPDNVFPPPKSTTSPVPNVKSGKSDSPISPEETDYSQGEGFALVINGHSLTHALKPKLERMFLELGCMMISVICCRVTPLQKAQVVELVKRNKKAVTLSVGDGANDVSMIKTAHIGVGISGQEGMQAVLASDFSIGQFRFLQRLLLVHGRWSYYRMSKFLRYFFYKNFSFTLTHFWYSFFSGYSAQTVYDPVLIACYNLFFTSLPVLSMGVLDQDVNDEYSLKYPKLYIPGQYNLFFNMRIFIYSVLHGLASSLVLFFVPYGALYEATDHSGRDMNDYSMLAFTVFTGLIVVVTGQIMLDTAYWTVVTAVVIFGSVAFYAILVIIFYQALPISVMVNTQAATSLGVVWRACASAQFWFSILMIAVLLLLPVMLNRFFWFDTHPSYADKLRVQHKTSARVDHAEVSGTKPLPRSAITRKSRRGSLRSGYAFSHSQGFGELIAKGKLFKNIEHLRNPSNRSSPPSKNTSKDSGLSPIVESPPGLFAASTTVPVAAKAGSRPSSKDGQRSATPTKITVNQGDDPLPSNWPRDSTTLPVEPPRYTEPPTNPPRYTALTVPRRTPPPSATSFPVHIPNIPDTPAAAYSRRLSKTDNVTATPMPLPSPSASNESNSVTAPRFVGRQRRQNLETEV